MRPFETVPRTRYAKSGEVNIAYQVVGDGPLDLVFVMGWVSHLDYFWEEPRFARFLRRLASFSRLILFDKRGTGLSDRVPLDALPTLEQRMDDVRAVLDAAGSDRAALLGISEGGPLSALFAATYPERTAALVMYGAYATRTWKPDFPWAPTPEERQRYFDQVEATWGSVDELATLAPSLMHDAPFRTWWAAYCRRCASPGAALALARMNTEVDVRHVLPAIHVPTLVLHRSGDRDILADGSRYLAARIPTARYVELPGADHLPFVGDQDALLAEVEQFLTGVRPVPEPETVLATVLVAEAVGAAEQAARLGDRRWGEFQAAHRALVREELARYQARQLTATLEGVVAAFDGPGRAIRCAEAVVAGADRLGLPVRAGVHTGELAVVGDELAGVAVHLAARVAAQAGPGQVLVSNTAKDLVAGSGLAFEPVGDRVFPGLPGEWGLYRVASGPTAVPPTTPGAAATDHPPATHAASGLSRREREVAALLALGLSNRQVADELAIAPATVERHVANILTKLGMRSRAQVAAWAVAQGLFRTRPD